MRVVRSLYAMVLSNPTVSHCCLPSCSVSAAAAELQDHPLVDDVKVTLDYDMDAPLAAPVRAPLNGGCNPMSNACSASTVGVVAAA